MKCYNYEDIMLYEALIMLWVNFDSVINFIFTNFEA